MKERDRIVQLVKQGILTTEEALVLLENMATEKDEHIADQEAEQVMKSFNQVDDKPEPSFEETVEKTSSDSFSQQEAEDKERLNAILEQLANETNQVSAEVDQINQRLQEYQKTIRQLEEQIMVLNTMEDLDTLDKDKEAKRQDLEAKLSNLHYQVAELEEKKKELDIKLSRLGKQHRSYIKEEWASKFDIPDEWKDQANEKMSQVGDKVVEASSQIGDFLKKTIQAVTTTVNDNIDWKDVNIKVPGVVSQNFTHQFTYPNATATIVDIKVANGSVVLKHTDDTAITVEASIKLYGKMDAVSPLEAFLERSEIDVTNEKVSFQIPNKRVRADLIVHLPECVYDHVAVKLLNGDITVNDITVNDIFTKNTNGQLTFNKMTAKMLEVEGVNGTIKANDCHIADMMAESVNGEVVIRSTIESLSISLINGDIKLSVINDSLQKAHVTTVNGAIKVSLPETTSFNVEAKTSLGSVKNRITDGEIVREKKSRTNHYIEYRRVNNEAISQLQLTTTTGNILLKNSDVK